MPTNPLLAKLADGGAMVAMYGPFHRSESPTQTPQDALVQIASGELWGRPPRGSDVPQVQAYDGPLPARQRGIQFETDVPPTGGSPPGKVKWHPDSEGVRLSADEEFAIISVRVTRNTQL